MTKSTEKKERQGKARLESYLHGFLQSRGYDLLPRVKRDEEVLIIELHYDGNAVAVVTMQAGQVDVDDSLMVGLSLVGELAAKNVGPRTPCPMNEIAMRMIRNEILGMMQDGIDLESSATALNRVAMHLTACLKRGQMSFPEPPKAVGDDEATEAAA